MNTTRNGKIARLPAAVREELNRRLSEGESGTHLRTWLHALPEVQAVLAAEFGGRPINAPNLTAWRQGGYRAWKNQAATRLLAARLGDKVPTPSSEVAAEMLSLRLGGFHLLARYDLAAPGDEKKRWPLLHELCGKVARLREMELDCERRELQSEWEKQSAADWDPSRLTSQPPE